MFSRLAALLIMGLLLAGGQQQAVAAGFAIAPATATPVHGPTSVPYGWVDFCSRHAEECNAPPQPSAVLRLTPESWRVLTEVNLAANGAITPVSNLEHWGTMLDHWDYPSDGKGDCKVYALYKRKLLMERGVPRQALLMTIVRDLNGDGHAILTVRTDRGDFVLDNLAPEVRAWNATGYRYVKRQSETDPNLWLEIDGWGDRQAALRRN